MTGELNAQKILLNFWRQANVFTSLTDTRLCDRLAIYDLQPGISSKETRPEYQDIATAILSLLDSTQPLSALLRPITTQQNQIRLGFYLYSQTHDHGEFCS